MTILGALGMYEHSRGMYDHSRRPCRYENNITVNNIEIAIKQVIINNSYNYVKIHHYF